MSEEFDKEAEREKLREKYERDREKREATQQMSELLLKGATMTNRHCDDCGDPIFRMDGEAFCPTCERTVEDESAAADQAANDADASQSPEEQGQAAAGTADAGRDGRPTGNRGDSTPDRAPTDVADLDATAPSSADAETDLAAGRQALTAALTRHARLAADSDDPRRARDHLQAAREAAEALAALA